MLKVLVFDSGWGGELFANYLEQELAVTKVIRVIDWRHAPHDKYSKETLRILTEFMLFPYIGRVDVIVLASYVVTDAALNWLRERHPKQIFLGFEIRMIDIAQAVNCKRVLAAGSETIYRSPTYLAAKNCLEKDCGIKVVELDCRNWTTLIDSEKIKDELLYRALYDYNWRKDMILILNTHYLDIKPRLEQIYDWRLQIADDFSYVLKAVSRALRLTRQYLRPAGTLTKAERLRLRLTEQQARAA